MDKNLIKSCIMFAAIMTSAMWGMSRVAPDWRDGEGPAWAKSGPQSSTSAGIDNDVKPLPALRKVAVRREGAVALKLDVGRDAKTQTSKDGSTEYQEAVAPSVLLGHNGKLKDDQGNYIGTWFDIPKRCASNVQALIGHAVPVVMTEWVLPTGEPTETTDRKAVVRALCDTRPDAVFDGQTKSVDEKFNAQQKADTADDSDTHATPQYGTYMRHPR